MLIFPDPSLETEYTDPNGSVWEFNGTGWVRQCAGSGGDDGGDGVLIDFDNAKWPIPPTPSIDLLAVRGAIYKVNPSNGSLSLYADTPLPISSILKFGRSTTQVAGVFNGPYVNILDYSDPSFPVVSEMIPLNLALISSLDFNSDDSLIYAGGGKDYQTLRFINGSWEAWGPATSLLDHLGKNYFLDAETLEDLRAKIEDSPESVIEDLSDRLLEADVLGNGIVSPRNAAGSPGSTMSFIAALPVKGDSSRDNFFQLRATDSGVVIDGSGSAIEFYGSSPVGIAPVSISQHPYEDYVVWGGAPERADNHPFLGGTYDCGLFRVIYDGAPKLVDSLWTADSGLNVPNYGVGCIQFSPSGNYIAMSGKEDKVSIFRLHRNGRLSKLTTFVHKAENGSLSTEIQTQWSCDEKYFYTWDQRKEIFCYDFNDGVPTSPRKVATAPYAARYGNAYRFERNFV